MRNLFIIYVTTHGDDWQDTEMYIEEDKFKAEHYNSIEYRDKALKVNGVEDISVCVEENTHIQLRDILTFNEYCEQYPEVGALLQSNIKETE